MILVFDTETTGKADFKAPCTAPHQPRIVQLGAQLLDDEFTVRGEINVIIKPDGWTISKEASDVHGITDEMAAKFGVSIKRALMLLRSFHLVATVRVAHNIGFDDLMVESEFYRMTGEKVPWRADSQKAFCTMDAMTNICRLPGPYGNKWPKLKEAYEFCFKEQFEGAHDALADVRACARIYKWIKTSL
jgi:DNA polymerase-3 subunit epsilon